MLLTTGLGLGGAEIVVRDLARSIDSERFNVSICCLKWIGPVGKELAEQGIDIYQLPGADRVRADYFSAFKLRRQIREKRIDIVHTHTTHALADAGLCRRITPGVKVVHTFHFGNYPHMRPSDLWIERIFARFVDRLIAVGHVQREQIKAAHHLPDRAIEALWNGVQLPAPGRGDPAFKAHIDAEGKIVIGTIATLISQKGLKDLLAVARRLRDTRDDFRFVVVGDGDLRPELERMRRDLGLDDTVLFTGWLKNAATLALPAFDIYFQPSLWEAMSISLLEAMAAGKPVVSTSVGEAPYVLDHGQEGFLFQPGDISGMASAISKLADDADLRSQLGGAAARKVAERFTVSHMTRAYEKLYLDVLQWDDSGVRRVAS